MSQIEWGPEIVVNGKRPEWLHDKQIIAFENRPGQWFGEKGEWVAGQYIWGEKGTNRNGCPISIRLPADHPHYAPAATHKISPQHNSIADTVLENRRLNARVSQLLEANNALVEELRDARRNVPATLEVVTPDHLTITLTGPQACGKTRMASVLSAILSRVGALGHSNTLTDTSAAVLESIVKGKPVTIIDGDPVSEETAWGEPIEVNGVRPDWLAEKQYLLTDTCPEYDRVEEAGRACGRYICGRVWNTVKAIRLPANHPYYLATAKGFTYWPGGDEAPKDLGDRVLYADGTEWPADSAIRWNRATDQQSPEFDIIGYRRKAEALKQRPPRAIGDPVTLLPEDDSTVPDGDHIISRVNPDGSFHVDGGNTAVWPRRICDRHHFHLGAEG